MPNKPNLLGRREFEECSLQMPRKERTNVQVTQCSCFCRTRRRSKEAWLCLKELVEHAEFEGVRLGSTSRRDNIGAQSVFFNFRLCCFYFFCSGKVGPSCLGFLESPI